MKLTTVTRLTLINMSVLVVCFAVLLLALTRLTSYFMSMHIEESMRSELALLQSEFVYDGDIGLASLVQKRIDSHSSGHQRYYWFESPKTSLRVSNLSEWPAQIIDDKTYYIPSQKGDEPSRIVTAAAYLSEGRRLLVGYDESELHGVQERLAYAAWLTLLMVVVASYLASRFMASNLFRPVAKMRESAVRIMNGDIHHRIAHTDNGDELNQLAVALNDMLNRIEGLIDSIQGASDNIAHDLRSPLTRLRARFESMRLQPAANYPEWIDEQLAELDRVLGIFNVLLRIARMDKALLRDDFSEIDIRRLCQDAVDYVEPLSDIKSMTLVVDIPAPVSLFCHKDLLFQLMINLLDNAIKYSPEHATIKVSCYQDGTAVHLSVQDNGLGMPEHDLQHAMDRFYRGDRSRHSEGVGLGLSLVKEVVALHGGTIQLYNATPGLMVDIVLPLAAA